MQLRIFNFSAKYKKDLIFFFTVIESMSCRSLISFVHAEFHFSEEYKSMIRNNLWERKCQQFPKSIVSQICDYQIWKIGDFAAVAGFREIYSTMIALRGDFVLFRVESLLIYFRSAGIVRTGSLRLVTRGVISFSARADSACITSTVRGRCNTISSAVSWSILTSCPRVNRT